MNYHTTAYLTSRSGRFSKLFSLLIMFLMCLSACADRSSFKKSTIVPAAEADLKIRQDRNNNYKIKLDVENLARPENLKPSKKLYLVWSETNEGSFNLGRLKVNNNLNGSLTAYSPYRPNRIKITAENYAFATSPGNQVVLTSREIANK